MDFQSLNCPNCGAPLHMAPGQSLVLCAYCASNVRVSAVSDARAEATAESVLPPDIAAQVKQLLFDGQRQAAIALYTQETHVSAADAEQAIQAFGSQVVLDIIQAQQLDGLGVMLILLCLLLLLASLGAWFAGLLPPPVAVVLALAAIFLMLPFRRAARTTLRFFGARSAPATVVKVAPIAVARGVHTYRILLEVRPADASSFRTEMNLPVREQNVSKMQPGLQMQVKYLPGDTRRVVFDRATG